jgi:pyridoxine 5'-phosphate synthase PdxJ
MWLPIFKNLAPKESPLHPRPDERHIRYQDARDLKAVVYTEFNIEGNPQHNFRFGFRMQNRAGNFSS